MYHFRACSSLFCCCPQELSRCFLNPNLQTWLQSIIRVQNKKKAFCSPNATSALFLSFLHTKLTSVRMLECAVCSAESSLPDFPWLLPPIAELLSLVPWSSSPPVTPQRCSLRLCLSSWVVPTTLRRDGSLPLFLCWTARSVKAGSVLLPLVLQRLDPCQVCSTCTVNLSWMNYIRQSTWLALMEKWSTTVSVEQREYSLGIEEGFT